jgi:hypothetical protein
MSENKNDNVVVAFFASEEAAEMAAGYLQNWDKASDDIKLGAVGTMVATPDGKIKTHVGRKAGKGAKTGAIVGIIAGVFTGGLTVVGGLVGGSVLGGVMGAFFKKSTNLTEDELNKIAEELKRGKAAVVVTCDDHEVAATQDHLAMSGGTVWTYQVPAEALDEAAAAADSFGEVADSAERAEYQAAAVAGPAAGVLGVAGAQAVAAADD